jgi:hypothetical protein
MTDEPKYPPHCNAELIDQYETFMRAQKAAPPASTPASLESPGLEEKAKSEPAAAAKAASKVFFVPPPTVPFEPAFFNPDDLTQVPGVVGKLIDWTVATALYPNRTLALGAALVTVGTLMSRRVMTPTRGVTHLYVVGVAESATGKQHPADCLKEALTVAGMSRVLCGEIKSAAALARILVQGPIICAVIDEYGLVLDRLVRSNATSSESSLMSDMRTLWGTQFGKQYHTATTLDRPVEIIYGPAFSIFALSIPEDVGAAFKSRQIFGGFFNRHLYLIGDKRPPKQDLVPGNVPDALVARLKALVPHLGVDAILKQPTSEIKSSKDEKPISVPITGQVELRWGLGAKAVWDQLDSLASEPDRMKQIMFARVPDMTVRLASIVAFGRGSRTVDEPDMLWACALAMRSAQDMYEAVLKHMEDPKSHNAMCQEILELFTESPDGFVSERNIFRKMRPYKLKGDDLKHALNQLIKEERIKAERRQTGGRPSDGYRLRQD